jgi:hypothetical protein
MHSYDCVVMYGDVCTGPRIGDLSYAAGFAGCIPAPTDPTKLGSRTVPADAYANVSYRL